MFDPPKGPWQIVPFASSARPDEYIDSLDRWAVEEFLRHCKPDYRIMSHLRDVLSLSTCASMFTDDEVVTTVAAKLVARELLLRRRIWRRVTAPPDPAGAGQQDQSSSSQTQESSSAPSVPQTKPRAWFSITVVHEVGGAQIVVDGLTLNCHLPDLGETSGLTSSRVPHIKYDDLDPGGTGDVLSTSHDEVVWEVTEDIS